MKKFFWKSDWFAGPVLSLAFLFATNSTFLHSIERNAYDVGEQASSRESDDKVAIVAIDDQRVADIARSSIPTVIPESPQDGLLPIPAVSTLSPITAVLETALAIGYLSANHGVDGSIRYKRLALSFCEQYSPLPLQIASELRACVGQVY